MQTLQRDRGNVIGWRREADFPSPEHPWGPRAKCSAAAPTL